MTQTRRQFIATSSTALGITTLLPFAAHTASQTGDFFSTSTGDIAVFPVSHASFVMNTPAGAIYCDPVGSIDAYKKFPRADLVLVTHHHGDHYKPDILARLVDDNTKMITNPTVFDKLPKNLKTRATKMSNGENTNFGNVRIDAVPAYNITENRKKFHPKGRDNGYVLKFGDFHIYISGDTEDTAEMRALKNIDLAFICMNLPFTMDVTAAAAAVAEFKPKFVYPYHYRGRDDGTQDPAEFARLIGDKTNVKMAPWYE